MPRSVAPKAHRLAVILLFIAAFPQTSCKRTDNAPTPVPAKQDEAPTVPAGEAPTPPLTIAEPGPPPESVGVDKLSTLDERQLLARALAFALAGKWAEAAQFQYWAVKKTEDHQYNLACYLAQSGQIDAAFYWLQVAAMEDGVDPGSAEEDVDLAILRTDPRWKQVVLYFEQCATYWESKSELTTILIVPRNYDGRTPLTTIVGLHGNGSKPQRFIGSGFQKIADALNVAFLGISGTIPRGKSSFIWSARPEDDHRHIVKALKSVEDRLQVKPGQVIAMGVEQGAQAGLEAAARHPESYAGALVFSPDGRKGNQHHLGSVRLSSQLARRGFVFIVGANEPQGNKMLTDRDQSWAQGAGAKVIYRLTPDQSESGFPRDLAERLPEWIRFVENAAER